MQNFLKTILDSSDWISVQQKLGFTNTSVEEKLRSFEQLRQAVLNSVSDKSTDTNLSNITKMESECYKHSGRAIYFSDMALLAVFTDCTERSPTFSLKPLDTVEQEDAGRTDCWIKARIKAIFTLPISIVKFPQIKLPTDGLNNLELAFEIECVLGLYPQVLMRIIQLLKIPSGRLLLTHMFCVFATCGMGTTYSFCHNRLKKTQSDFLVKLHNTNLGTHIRCHINTENTRDSN